MAELERILGLYGKFNKHVQFCQGMNYIAGTLQAAGFGDKDMFFGLHSLVHQYCQGGRVKDNPKTRHWYFFT